MTEPHADARYAEIRAAMAHLLEKVAQPNRFPRDNESHWESEGWKNGTANALIKLNPTALLDEIERLRAEVAELKAAAGRVRGLHQPDGGHCGTCADTDGQAARWPCDTARALEGATPAGAADADDEWVRCSGLHCPNSERFAKAAERGWENGHMDTWLCPQCAADRREHLSVTGRRDYLAPRES